jgi:hypothetical protein
MPETSFLGSDPPSTAHAFAFGFRLEDCEGIFVVVDFAAGVRVRVVFGLGAGVRLRVVFGLDAGERLRALFGLDLALALTRGALRFGSKAASMTSSTVLA